MVLILAVDDPAGIAENMKHHLLRSAQVLRDLGEIIRERVVIRGQAQWPGERLKTGVSTSDGVQRADTGVGLGIICNGVGADRSGSQSNADKGLRLRDNLELFRSHRFLTGRVVAPGPRRRPLSLEEGPISAPHANIYSTVKPGQTE